MSKISNWDDLVKKEARGINDYDLGEVHEVEPEIVVTKKRGCRQGQVLFTEKSGRAI